MTNYEVECLSRYEGTYSPREIELNKALYDECIKEAPDFAKIEELLKQGADPLGGTEVSGWGLVGHVYGEIIGESQRNNSIHLPHITELFLKYGMNIDNPRIPYDDDNSLHPMWMFAFVMNENSVYALEMLLDHGMSAGAAGEMWGHVFFDLINISCGDPSNDEFWNYECTWAIKLTMLCASYEHIINNDEDLQEFIECSSNDYDLRKFRAWNDFRYEFDTSGCEKEPELYRSVVKIFEKASGKEVWRFRV
jgi:hypothetical protein